MGRTLSTSWVLRPLQVNSRAFCGMQYENVCIEAIAYTLPDEVVTSAELEARLSRCIAGCACPRGAVYRYDRGRIETRGAVTPCQRWSGRYNSHNFSGWNHFHPSESREKR